MTCRGVRGAITTDDNSREGILKGVRGVSSFVAQHGTETDAVEYLIESEKGTDIRAKIFSAFADRKVPLIGLRVKNATLEEIFLELTSGVKEVVK